MFLQSRTQQSATMPDKTPPCDINGDAKCRELYCRLLAAGLVVLVLLAVLIVWLVLRPADPEFSLQDASLLHFNLTSAAGGPVLLTTALRATLSVRNPNGRIGVYYDGLDARASYRGERVTAPTALPAGYLGPVEVPVWTPYLCGAAVPFDFILSDAIHQDISSGCALLYIHVDGRLRWKVGNWLSGRHHLRATCTAFLTADSRKWSGGRAPHTSSSSST